MEYESLEGSALSDLATVKIEIDTDWIKVEDAAVWACDNCNEQFSSYDCHSAHVGSSMCQINVFSTSTFPMPPERRDSAVVHRKYAHLNLKRPKLCIKRLTVSSFKCSSSPRQNSQKSNFHCIVCTRIFKGPQLLSNHQRAAHSEHQLMRERMKSGTEMVLEEGPFKCKSCPDTFWSDPDLMRHNSSTHLISQSQTSGRMNETDSSDPSLTCPCCQLTFEAKRSYLKHMITHTQPRHRCVNCIQEFTNISDLTKHCAKAHPSPPAPPTPVFVPTPAPVSVPAPVPVRARIVPTPSLVHVRASAPTASHVRARAPARTTASTPSHESARAASSTTPSTPLHVSAHAPARTTSVPAPARIHASAPSPSHEPTHVSPAHVPSLASKAKTTKVPDHQDLSGSDLQTKPYYHCLSCTMKFDSVDLLWDHMFWKAHAFTRLNPEPTPDLMEESQRSSSSASTKPVFLSSCLQKDSLVECPYCSQQFYTAKHIDQHLRSHERSVKGGPLPNTHNPTGNIPLTANADRSRPELILPDLLKEAVERMPGTGTQLLTKWNPDGGLSQSLKPARPLNTPIPVFPRYTTPIILADKKFHVQAWGHFQCKVCKVIFVSRNILVNHELYAECEPPIPIETMIRRP